MTEIDARVLAARQANRNLASATECIRRALAFGLHAAADADDETTRADEIKLAGELRRTLLRLPHITFGDPAPTTQLRSVDHPERDREAAAS